MRSRRMSAPTESAVLAADGEQVSPSAPTMRMPGAACGAGRGDIYQTLLSQSRLCSGPPRHYLLTPQPVRGREEDGPEYQRWPAEQAVLGGHGLAVPESDLTVRAGRALLGAAVSP